jgi:hypothetical protein
MHPAGTALVSLLSAAFGAWFASYLNHGVEETLLRKTAALTAAQQTLETRIGLLKETTLLLSEGLRLSFVYRSRSESERFEFTRVVSCISRASHDAEFCKSGATKSIDPLLLDVSQLTAKFEALRTMASFYFCETTRASLAILPADAFWWNADPAAQLDVLEKMKSELTCDIEKYRAMFDGSSSN